MRLLVVEAPGVLYPSEERPPNADPITSGLRLVRAITEGFGVPVAIVGQIPVENHREVLKAWLTTYDITHAHILSDIGTQRNLEFWESEVLTHLGAMQAQPPVVITSSTAIAEMLTTRAVPTIQFRPPDGNAPNWGPQRSSWADKYTFTEE